MKETSPNLDVPLSTPGPRKRRYDRYGRAPGLFPKYIPAFIREDDRRAAAQDRSGRTAGTDVAGEPGGTKR